MSTRAIAWLRQRKIPHEVAHYDHAEKGAAFAAEAVGFPLGQTVKTLVVDLSGGGHGLALVPGDRQLSLKKAAQAFGVKKAAMAGAASAERLTGYHVGGITPFGLRQLLRAAIEESLLDHEIVMINGGRRGLMLKMAPAAIVDALRCHVAALTA